MIKDLSWKTGFVTNVSETVVVKTTNKFLHKATVTFETADGQTAFFEVRKKVIDTITKEAIKKGSKVTIGYVFMGSEKNGKIYNNLYINSIEHVK